MSAPSDPPGNPLRQLTLDQLRQRTSAKWRTHADDVLPLWVAEMDVPLAEPIAAAVTDAIALGDTGYPYGTAYIEAMAAFAAERWGWDGLAADRARLVPDVMLGYVELLTLLTAPGDAVIVNCPVYPPFYAFTRDNRRQIVEAPLNADQRIDMEALAAAFTDARADNRQAVYLLCNPHNPTGTVHTAAELTAVAALADEHGVRVVADEIHAPLVEPGTAFTPYLAVPGSGDGLSLLSASKAWNLAGLKAAIAVAGSGAADDLARMPADISDHVAHLAVIAHTAALRDGGPWLDALLAGIAANRRLLTRLLERRLPDIRYQPEPGTYLAWLDCRALGMGADPAATFLERGRVALNSGHWFGTGGEGRVRLNYATSPEILTEAIDRMAASVH